MHRECVEAWKHAKNCYEDRRPTFLGLHSKCRTCVLLVSTLSATPLHFSLELRKHCIKALISFKVLRFMFVTYLRANRQFYYSFIYFIHVHSVKALFIKFCDSLIIFYCSQVFYLFNYLILAVD